MDFINKAVSAATSAQQKDSSESAPKKEEKKKGGLDGVLGMLGGKVNEAAGGGKRGEEKEDMLDKAIDAFQEHVLKAGPQDNESATEQMKDKMIADTIRSQYKNYTGKDIPISKKEESR